MCLWGERSDKNLFPRVSEEGAERQKSLKISANENHFTLREVYISRVSEEGAKQQQSLKTGTYNNILLENCIHFSCVWGGSEATNIIENKNGTRHFPWAWYTFPVFPRRERRDKHHWKTITASHATNNHDIPFYWLRKDARLAAELSAALPSAPPPEPVAIEIASPPWLNHG